MKSFSIFIRLGTQVMTSQHQISAHILQHVWNIHYKQILIFQHRLKLSFTIDFRVAATSTRILHHRWNFTSLLQANTRLATQTRVLLIQVHTTISVLILQHRWNFMLPLQAHPSCNTDQDSLIYSRHNIDIHPATWMKSLVFMINKHLSFNTD